jgi:hypothetical protein
MKLKSNIAISDSGFVFNPSTGDSYSINPVGIFILNMLKEEKSDPEILSTLQAKYMVDKDTAEKDLYDFKNMLGGLKLIE